MNITKLTYTIPALLIGINFAQAQTCATAPSCAELGFTKSAVICSGKSMIKCPFDQSKVFCADETSCDALGFTDIASECPGSYSKCPSDASRGKCDFEASPGDLKYSLRTSNHNGWLLCNGSYYNANQYPELYSAISGSFGSYLPSYSGYFLKAGATTSTYTLKTSEQAGLPNIYGQIGYFDDSSGGSSGPIYDSGSVYWDVDQNGSYRGKIKSFDASRSSSIYGRSSTVTPQNYTANVFIYSGRKKF